MIRVLVLALLLAVPAAAQETDDDTPQSRAEVLARARQEKAQRLEPPRPNALERTLLTLENDRILERLLNPAEGFYPKMGNITPGSGFAIGPAYRAPHVFGDDLHISAFGMVSLQKYWVLEGRFDAPELANGRLFADAYVRRYDYADEPLFLPEPRLDDEGELEEDIDYSLRSTDVGGRAGIRLTDALSFSGGIAYLTPRVSLLPEQPDFVRGEVTAEINTREPRGNPRQGARYALTYQRYDGRDGARFDFDRFEADVQQYISLYRQRRVLALRGLVSLSDPSPGGEIPFYYQRTLGGPDDLRGLNRFRLRDRHLLLLQAEYRWEIFTAMDGAIFYDAGKVASRKEDLNFKDLESDYGVGFRFGTRSGVFLRIEGAFGSSDGPKFIMRYGHVF